jgi:DNA-binding beta-propeller fold protein YncE
MYITGTDNDAIYQYTVSTPWNVATASNSMLKAFFVQAIDNSPAGIAFSPDGRKLYLVGSGSDAITELLVN